MQVWLQFWRDCLRNYLRNFILPRGIFKVFLFCIRVFTLRHFFNSYNILNKGKFSNGQNFHFPTHPIYESWKKYILFYLKYWFANMNIRREANIPSTFWWEKKIMDPCSFWNQFFFVFITGNALSTSSCIYICKIIMHHVRIPV